MTQPISPRKPLLMLTALVLVLHLALLRATPITLSAAPVEYAPMVVALRSLPTPPQTAQTLRTLAEPAERKVPRKAVAAAAPITTSQEPVVTSAGTEAEAVTSLLKTADVLAAASKTDTKVVAAGQEAVSARPVPHLASAMVSAEGLPGSIKLLYKVKSNKFPYNLDAELLWSQKESHYFASFRVGVFGQYRIQTSRGSIAQRGLVPERFSDKFRSEVAAHFNWPQNKVTFSANTPDVALQDGAQDRMSVLIQLAALLATAPAQRTPGTNITLQTVGPRDAADWLFAVGESEDLSVPSDPADKVQAIKITRKPRQLYDQQMELWMAPALNYLPARIRLLEANGDFVDQRWYASLAVESP